jgi:glycerol-3-phosphate acyltransferase PlsX
MADAATDPALAGQQRARVVVDVAGGDAPLSIRVAGALSAARLYGDTDVFLCGAQPEVEREIEKLGGRPDNVTLVHAPEQIGMHEQPVQALRQKKRSSICVGVEMVARGEADAFVSAGNTGAVAAAGTLKLGCLRGVQRPGIAAAMQVIDHPVVAIDVGANVDCKPMHLLHYGIMANVFAREVLNIPNPRVGLLNIGKEDGKGNELTRQGFCLLSSANLNFVGNVEPNAVFHNGCDIVVCDGFTGNVVLKMGESLTIRFIGWLQERVRRNLLYTLGFALCKSLFRHLKQCADYAEYGGAPLLGVNGIIIKTHGASDARGIQNAIREARSFVRHQVNAHIEEAILADAASRGIRA